MISYHNLSDPDMGKKKGVVLIRLIGNPFLTCCNEIPSRRFSKSWALATVVTASYNEVKVQALEIAVRFTYTHVTKSLFLWSIFFKMNVFCRTW